MDGVTDVRFCIEMGKLGGLGVINLEGVQTRYANPSEVLAQIVKAGKDEVTALIQKVYLEPIKEDLIAQRIQELKQAGVLAAVSSIPQKAGAFWRHRPGGRRGCFCRPIHRFHCQTSVHRVQIARPGRILPRDEISPSSSATLSPITSPCN